MVKKLVVVSVLMMLLASTGALAQHKDWKSWYGEFSIGYVLPEVTAPAPGGGGDIDVLDEGWNISGGAIYKPKDWPLGITMELGYNQMDIDRELLQQLDVGGGDVDIWSATGGFIWSTANQGPVHFYLEGGIGWYRISAKLTEPGLVRVPPWCGWYWCYPGGVAPADIVTDSGSTTRFGYNAGFGVGFEVGSGSEVFLEVKYHGIQTTNETTEYLPVSVGYRW